jgi:hypothetical protein
MRLPRHVRVATLVVMSPLLLVALLVMLVAFLTIVFIDRCKRGAD